jgi:homogentisate solanesyltransferase
MTVFATVIAITKDLPDIEGDKKYNISTFAGKFGIEAVSKSAAGVLSTAYIVAITLAFLGKTSFKFLPMAGGHAALLTYFLFSIRKLDLSKITSVKRFYKVIWNLFYLEYCLYPFI